MTTEPAPPPRAFGYRHDPYSPNDFVLHAAKASMGGLPLPAEYMGLALQAAPVQNQSWLEACVGFALAQAVHARLGVQGLPQVLPSPCFLWWNSRRSHGEHRLNTGTYMRSALDMARKVGIPPEGYWPTLSVTAQGSKLFSTRPDEAAYQNGYDARFELRYHRLTKLGQAACDEVRGCLAHNMPVLVGAQVTHAFTELTQHGPQRPPEVWTEVAGGHALCILGYDEQSVHGPNSWGEEWGNEGWFRLDWEYIASTWVVDRWALEFVPRLA